MPDPAARGDPRPRRRRHPEEERESLRRLTIWAAVGAVALNAFLFLQTAAGPLGSGDVGKTIAAVLNAAFPGTGLGPPTETPLPVRATPLAVSGGS
jgi:hypothetical protein